MSGWIKMGVHLRTHPKVVRMASALRADRLRVVGGLWAVWCIFDAHTDDGLLEGYTLQAIDDDLGWKGFAAAMQAIGWLEETESGLRAPDYEDHNGPSAKRRATETKRKADNRADAGDKRTKSERFADSKQNESGQMSASDADTLRAREEKRREEKKNSPSVRSSGEKRASAPPRPEDVAEQVWTDWLTLRKQKRAPVTATVLEGARSEAVKAGITLDAFLRVWCRRGSQGLEASWLKTDEKTGAQQLSFRERDQAAARAAGHVWMGSLAPKDPNVIDMEAANVRQLANR